MYLVLITKAALSRLSHSTEHMRSHAMLSELASPGTLTRAADAFLVCACDMFSRLCERIASLRVVGLNSAGRVGNDGKASSPSWVDGLNMSQRTFNVWGVEVQKISIT